MRNRVSDEEARINVANLARVNQVTTIPRGGQISSEMEIGACHRGQSLGAAGSAFVWPRRRDEDLIFKAHFRFYNIQPALGTYDNI